MSFVSVAFLLFLPAVVALHWVWRNRVWQNTVLVAASYLFYGWWDWRFCFLLLGASLVDFVAGAAIDRCAEARTRRLILMSALATHLLVLGFFKYFHFFVESLALALALAGWDLATTGTLEIILPVGISFYTFQTMSYTLDIYRRRFRPRRSLLDYLTFVSFFPQLVAGPIERAGQLLPQFTAARSFDLAAAREGCRFILWGFAKKMLLADNLAPLVNQAYAVPAAAGGGLLALATLAFAFQIYCDFSAYSDIAVGTGRLFGVRLCRNFAYPYFAQSLSEFWRRWHISLSTWFRDYVYIPLGGSRGSPSRTVGNLLATCLLSGLWHGASWHFVGWGAWHGALLGAGRMVSRGQRPPGGKGPSSGGAPASAEAPALAVPGGAGLLPSWGVVWRMGRTFGLVCLAWVLFRAGSLADAGVIYGRLVAGVGSSEFYREIAHTAARNGLLFTGLGLFVAVEWMSRRNWNTLAVAGLPPFWRWAIYTVLVWLCLGLGTERTAEFIYFRF